MKKRGLHIHIHLTNRWLYTFIVIATLAIIGVGVYALNPGIIPNPGHNYTDIALCAEGEGLVTQGGKWVCSTGGGYCAGGTCSGNLIVTGKLTAGGGRNAFYKVTNPYCSGVGTITNETKCTARNANLATECGGQTSCYPASYTYVKCTGGCTCAPPPKCDNTLFGYVV